jgi:hypothetical protein
MMCRVFFLLQTAVAFSALLPSSSSASSSWCEVPESTLSGRNVAKSSTTEATTAKTTTLTFNATIVAESQPMQNSAALTAFFPTRDCRRYLISSGGTAPVQDVQWDDELKSFFYKRYGNDQKDLPQYVHAVKDGIQFPGLHIQSTVTIASRLTCNRNTSGKDKKQPPCYYENFLIAEESRASGLAPLVWLYHKLSPPNAGRKIPLGGSRTKISLDASQNIVSVNSLVSIQLQFPKSLVRLLPTTQDKMEAQGSTSVQKAVSKGIAQTLAKLPDMVAKHGASATLK